MNKNLILEQVENSFVFIYKNQPQFNNRLCCIANRTFLDAPDVSKIISFGMLSKRDINHPTKPCYGAWEIDFAGADRGTGQKLLLEFMTMPDVEYVMCDRESLSSDAEKAWTKIVNAMSNITVKLDSYLTPMTPEKEDDCLTYHDKDDKKYSIDNPYDLILKVPPMSSTLEHFDVSAYFKDDPQKMKLADFHMRKKFNDEYAAQFMRAKQSSFLGDF
jgi:hypothetical protein